MQNRVRALPLPHAALKFLGFILLESCVNMSLCKCILLIVQIKQSMAIYLALIPCLIYWQRGKIANFFKGYLIFCPMACINLANQSPLDRR